MTRKNTGLLLLETSFITISRVQDRSSSKTNPKYSSFYEVQDDKVPMVSMLEKRLHGDRI